MKKIFSYLFVFIFILLSSKQVVYAEDFDSRFSDINFYNCVKDKLSETDVNFLDTDGSIKDSYFSKITDLDCSDMGITDISGIEYLINLKNFTLSSNCSVTDIDLSNNLELENININCNTVETVKLGQKNSLKELNLSNNRIKDINISSYSPDLLTSINLERNNFSSKPSICNIIECDFGYIVTFDSQGGSSVQSQNTNSTVAFPDNTSKTGYKFLGWYYNGELYDFDTKVTSDMTLVANWEQDDLAQESEFISTSNSIFSKMMITIISLFVAFCFGFIAYTLLKSKSK